MSRQARRRKIKPGKPLQRAAVWLGRKSRIFRKPPLTKEQLRAVGEAVQGEGYAVVVEEDADFAQVRVTVLLGLILKAARDKDRWAKQICWAAVLALRSVGVVDRNVSVHLQADAAGGNVVYFGRAYYSAAAGQMTWKTLQGEGNGKRAGDHH